MVNRWLGGGRHSNCLFETNIGQFFSCCVPILIIRDAKVAVSAMQRIKPRFLIRRMRHFSWESLSAHYNRTVESQILRPGRKSLDSTVRFVAYAVAHVNGITLVRVHVFNFCRICIVHTVYMESRFHINSMYHCMRNANPNTTLRFRIRMWHCGINVLPTPRSSFYLFSTD